MILAIIQARLNSHRFPHKILADIEGKSMLVRVVERVQRSSYTDLIAVACPLSDFPAITELLRDKSEVMVYGGSPFDVLSRYYNCLKLYIPYWPRASLADCVVRITSDCPLVDPKVLDDMIQYYWSTGVQYLCNPAFGDGLDIEIISPDTLRKCHLEAKKPYDREHVTTYILEHKAIFETLEMGCKYDLSHIDWSVDKPEDLEFVRKVYRELGENFTLEDIIAKYPEVTRVPAKS